MSTRWYPLYQKGNPQLRVFLPNFWMKLIAPKDRQPSNVVQFHCSMEMTKYDVKNYLSKIYDVHPVVVRTRIDPGKFLEARGRISEKLPDRKIAIVVLDENESFEFPKVLEAFDAAQKERQEDAAEKLSKFTLNVPKNIAPGQVSWFDNGYDAFTPRE